MKLTYLHLVCGLFAGILAFSSCSREEVETEPLIRPVRYQKVFATGGSRIRTFSGTAQAGAETNLSFKVSGTIQDIRVKVGDQVRRGQVISTMDPKDYRIRVEEAEAALEQAQAQSRTASASYDRVQALYENRNASKQDLDAARAASESAHAQVSTIEKRLELARLQVEYTQLKAPTDGDVAMVTAEVNENVQSGMPVVTITSGAIPEVKVTVPEVIISQVKMGSKATVTFDAVPGKVFNATVTEVGVASTGYMTTFPVTVRLTDIADEVRPGMAGEVSFRFETADSRERILVPPVAVGEDRQGRFLFIVEPAEEGFGFARRRAVTIGELTSEGLEVFKGVQENDLVITAGVSKIVDGQKVKLQ